MNSEQRVSDDFKEEQGRNGEIRKDTKRTKSAESVKRDELEE